MGGCKKGTVTHEPKSSGSGGVVGITAASQLQHLRDSTLHLDYCLCEVSG